MKTKYLFIGLVILLQSCSASATPKKEIYNSDFKWTITIPENFERVSAEDWAKMQNKGADAIEKTYNTEVVNLAKTIFVFKSDQFNYFESIYQPFDSAIDGDFLESFIAVNNAIYGTFKAQMSDIKIDSSRTVLKVDDLEFQKFAIKIEFPNNVVYNVLMFTRLFGKKEFTVNIMYINKDQGELMIDSWMKSTFGK